MRRAYVEWSSGVLEIADEAPGLVVKGSNLTLAIGLRELSVRGPVEGFREHPLDRRGESKMLYIDLAFPVKGLEGRRGSPMYRVSADFSVGVYGVGYTRLEGVGFYLTIHPPPGALYRHIVVGEHQIAVAMIGRRQVYYMEEAGGVKKIILV